MKTFKLKIPAQQRAKQNHLCICMSAQQEGNHVWYKKPSQLPEVSETVDPLDKTITVYTVENNS